MTTSAPALTTATISANLAVGRRDGEEPTVL
jgi:hypothetical protein